jgi:4-hydroxy-tetrahydrodipicolinate synthase
MYMMELLPAGICGVMPGVTVLPVLDRVYRLRQAGQDEEAYRLFQTVLPFIVFQLQDMELFLHLEKRLLRTLGVIDTVRVREATIHLDPTTEAYGAFLMEQTVRAIEAVTSDE